MLALVFGLLIALIQGVFALIRAIRMTNTGRCRQAGDAGGFGSAVFAGVGHVAFWLNVHHPFRNAGSCCGDILFYSNFVYSLGHCIRNPKRGLPKAVACA